MLKSVHLAAAPASLVALATAAPEPSIWMLMIAGVAMIGAGQRFGKGRRVWSTSAVSAA